MAPRISTPAASSTAAPSRSVSIAVGAVVVLSLAVVVARGPRKEPAQPAATPLPLESGPPPSERLASAIAELSSLPSMSPPPMDKIHAALDGIARSDKGQKMPDGKDPPPLPAGSPHWIRFGVILVRYEGAQFAPKDAPPRDIAELRAKVLRAEAEKDFAAAVKNGDVGSMTDIGSVKRGVLEPATQYQLFTLPVSGLSPILDTPRGFWIVKRWQ